jgi:thymidine phosphorylase
VGRGIGPALEARDALAVLKGEADAPADLRERAVALAGEIIEMSGQQAAGSGLAHARASLADGTACRKFCDNGEAQGGLREPPRARLREPVVAERGGRVRAIDNRRLARAAKLAGAPKDAAAGLQLHVRLGDVVQRGQPLFTLHGDAKGELAYARAFAASHGDIFDIAVEPADAR